MTRASRPGRNPSIVIGVALLFVGATGFLYSHTVLESDYREGDDRSVLDVTVAGDDTDERDADNPIDPMRLARVGGIAASIVGAALVLTGAYVERSAAR